MTMFLLSIPDMSAIVTPEVELPTLSLEPLVPVSKLPPVTNIQTVLTITDPLTGEPGPDTGCPSHFGLTETFINPP